MAQWILLKFGMNVPGVDLFQIPWTNFDLTKNMAAVGGAYYHYMTYSETLKNLLHNGSMDFITIWYECSLGGPLLDSLNKFWSDKKHGHRGRGLLSLYDIKWNFKKSSP